MDREQFGRQIRPLWQHYREQNAWVGRWVPSWNLDTIMNDFVDAAFNLYEATANNELKIVLLGGTGIRTNKHLVQNFGVTGANGIQDRATQRHADIEQFTRDFGQNRPKPSVPVVGVGSLLSEQSWTPMLNDALIVGSATADHEFQLALEDDLHHVWRECERDAKGTVRPAVEARVNEVQHAQRLKDVFEQRIKHNPGFARNQANRTQYDRLSTQFRNTSSAFHHGVGREFYKEVWIHFLNENLDMLWDNRNKIPRVLARELIGLFLFGYRPRLQEHDTGIQEAPQSAASQILRLCREAA